jgi:hypothetical protein
MTQRSRSGTVVFNRPFLQKRVDRVLPPAMQEAPAMVIDALAVARVRILVLPSIRA